MITEKGIRDHCWCPAMWTEKEGNSKRVKPSREDDITLDLIDQAFNDEDHNKKVFLELTSTGMKALPFDGKGFWVAPMFEDINLLLILTELEVLERKDLQSGEMVLKLVVRRNQRLPDTEEIKEGELHVLRFLWVFFKHRYSEWEILIETKIAGQLSKLECSEVSSVSWEATREFFQRMMDVSEEEAPIIPTTDNCSYCWWRRKCSAVLKAANAPTSGRVKREVL